MSCSRYNSSASGLGEAAQVLRVSALSPGEKKLRKEIRLTISYLTIWLVDWQETFIKVVIEPFTTANVATLSRSVWAFELFLSLVINH